MHANIEVGDSGGQASLPGRMFVADGYDAWDAEVTLTGASLAGGTVDVTFNVDRHDVDHAYLAVIDGDGYDFVSALDGPLAPGAHNLSDESPQAGDNEYFVIVEKGPNGAMSLTTTVTVP